jgi:hypothetical protein
VTPVGKQKSQMPGKVILHGTRALESEENTEDAGKEINLRGARVFVQDLWSRRGVRNNGVLGTDDEEVVEERARAWNLRFASGGMKHATQALLLGQMLCIDVRYPEAQEEG